VPLDALSRSLRSPASLTRLGVSAGLIVAAGFVAGFSVGARERAARATATSPVPPPPVTGGSEALEELRQRGLFFPVPGAQSTRLADSFDEARGGGRRRHRAVDIMAPRHTPVRAVDDGVLVKLSRNPVGGLTLYQADSAGRYGYFYAHLERYAPGLREGRRVQRGEILAYVGSSGNASPRAPHLHFAIHRLDGSRRGWSGDPLNPYLVLRSAD
jgi:peptidoglycan LD-endopeptidase LytH